MPLFLSSCGFLPPTINDITTSVTPVPELRPYPQLPKDLELNYPAEFWSTQLDHYKSIQPLEWTGDNPQFAWISLSEKLMEENKSASWGWTFVDSSEGEMRLQAVAETPWLSFKDDLVLLMREEKGVWRLHMRSKSRVGRNDFGANAERIRKAFSLAVRSGLGFREINANRSH